MSERQAFVSNLSRWLEDGPDAAPPDLIDVVLADVEDLAQKGRVGLWRRGTWRAWPASARIVLAAALTAIAVIVSMTWSLGRGPSVGPPIPTPTASVAPSPTSTRTPLPTPSQPLVRVSPSPQGTFFFDPCLPSDSPSVSVSGTGFDGSAIHGWIAYGEGARVLAVNPANPDQKVVLEGSLDADPTSWSPDGRRLLVVAQPQESPMRSPIVLGSDGSATRLSNWATGAFSPDGGMVVYASPGGGLCYATPDGNYREHLAFDMSEPFDEFPAWSPDGSTIAFLDFVEDSPVYGNHAYGLSFINADGSNLRQLVVSVPGEEGHGGLSWSPDGTRLVFWDAVEGVDQIFLVNADGSELRQVTTEGSNNWPAWSPDGSRIAFVHDGALSTMTPEGTEIRPVGDVRPDGSIAWNPAP